jgi:hypothetical protein
LRDWKDEINASVGTTFDSELAQLPGGRKLTEGAWQYKRAVASNNHRQYARAIGELSGAMESSHSLGRIAAFVLVHLIARRTNRSLPSPPEVPEYAMSLIHRLAQAEHHVPPQSPELQLSISDISPLNEDHIVMLST